MIIPKTIKLTIDSYLENVFWIGLAVRSFCSYFYFNEVESCQIELSVVEAVTNSIKHAYQMQPMGKVDVIVSIDDRSIIFDICDKGKTMMTFEKATLEFDPQDIESLPEGGMGLYIIQNTMDEVIYKQINGMNILTLIKYLKKI
ncbi:MAG: ATP-binding protein [Desulfobacterales bacterium]|nr:ATP-binding protein [Desulfobacterales bacterium]